MFNKIILAGRLTKDPELRYTGQGLAVASFGLAVNSKTKQGDESKDETLFIDITVFGRQAETCGQYLSKGSPVIVDGRLRERRWESEGQKRSKFEVVSQDVRFLPKRSGEPSRGGQDGFTAPDEMTDLEPF
ncbi:MAG: single-stranded DNA-binding protein [Nitrospirae bacterium]|nr:single-stranded DNA-binding protein [Nitrospirota bacterium]MBF0536406.1 single-stranded DNA-binding protein [Nitrospirota bacterium]MBF0618328.1 single-stranded DNA-binding protein [Nitrospirota bacterium]